MLQLQNEPIIFEDFLLSFLMLLRTERERESERGGRERDRVCAKRRLAKIFPI